MSVKLSDVFSNSELQLAQVAMAKASAGCTLFFNTEDGHSISALSTPLGRRVSLCCFNQELSLLCGQSAFEQARVSGGQISDTHKCRCGACYNWVDVPIQNELAGYCQIRTTDTLARHSTHLAASYVRTMSSVGSLRLARNQISTSDPDHLVSLDPTHLYGHPTFLPLARMISEAGRSLLHASRCLFFSYDSSSRILSAEFVSDLSQEQVSSLEFTLREFPLARQALETLSFVLGGGDSIPPHLAMKLRPVVGDDRFLVLPIWVVGHVLGFLVFTAIKTQPDKIGGQITLVEFGQAASNLMAVLGFRLEGLAETEDSSTQVGMIQRYAAMGQMAAEIGHDIQASLYGMKNYAYLLGKAVKDDPRKVTYTRAITEGISYIERLSSEMRKLTGEPRQVTFALTDLCKIIESAVLLLNPLAMERTITIVKKLPESMPIIQADPIALTEVFLNLGLNAIHSMSEGGQIRIEVKHEDGKVHITFQDNGSGITPEILAKFWNNSSYAAKSFANKGLFIVQRIIRQHHGVIEVDSKPGAGTTFFIELWVNPSLSAPKTEAEKRIPPSYQAPVPDRARPSMKASLWREEV
ncbi:MAG: HAMP domain-containing histidine kinase [Verrucomicrobiae bacterium]|nr:HAMP domain-containing histidine kinase [Verrucomicrobiae bacterium]